MSINGRCPYLFAHFLFCLSFRAPRSPAPSDVCAVFLHRHFIVPIASIFFVYYSALRREASEGTPRLRRALSRVGLEPLVSRASFVALSVKYFGIDEPRDKKPERKAEPDTQFRENNKLRCLFA